MFGFNYYTPTKVVFGKETETQVASLIKEFGGKKVLIHYGGGSVIRSGLMKKVTDSLDAAGIPYVMLGGAVPNPRLSLVYEGIGLCKKEGVDFLLAVGGGSAIDSAMPKPSVTVSPTKGTSGTSMITSGKQQPVCRWASS